MDSPFPTTNSTPLSQSEMIALRDALQRSIASGLRRVQLADKLLEYQTTGDMQRALADLERKISTTPATRQITLQTSKGLFP